MKHIHYFYIIMAGRSIDRAMKADVNNHVIQYYHMKNLEYAKITFA